MVEAYFDESGTDGQSPIMAVAGYVMVEDQARRLDAEWKQVLEEFNLEYFHMASCAHGAGIFKKVTRDHRIEIGKRMIGIVKCRVEKGVVALVSEQEFEELAHPSFKTVVGGAYSWCIQICLQGVAQHIKSLQANSAAYFFESGHRDQNQTHRILNRLVSVPELKEKYVCSSITFAKKIPERPEDPHVRPLQAADLFAWQICKRYKDMNAQPRRPPRMDFLSLMECPHELIHLSRERILQAPLIASLAHSLLNPKIGNSGDGVQYTPEKGQ
jgi:Protein of unknown function (DUF3800)